ncbi:hypothetical protein HYX17_01050 [Candidatus Woesearchaeota archaeon]|nr:hypothetical protein [Candidatus Woesearchaeota archaeon]
MNSDFKKKRFTIEARKRLHNDISSFITSYKKEDDILKKLKNPTLCDIANLISGCILDRHSEDIKCLSSYHASLKWLSNQPLEKLYSSIDLFKDPNYKVDGNIPVEDRVKLAKELVYELKLKARPEIYRELEKRGPYAQKTGD